MQFQLTFVLHLGLLSFTKAQDECSRGACHPTTGDLLVGRSAQLTASSTCGLDRAQKYCILSYLEGEQKCFICDSRFPYDPYTQSQSHTIENVITSFEPDRGKKWWQAENGLDHVSIRLDLEALFQFSHLILTFKTFRPAAMLVERSTDYGHTWKVLRYFAKDCATSFPNVTSGQAQGLGDLVCDSRYSDIEPSSGGEVILKVLDPRFEIENPYSPYIQDLVTLTNLRINFTQLHTLGDTLLGRRENGSLDKYYYALSKMVVRGSCFCHGHASECGPVQHVRGDVFSPPGMVHGRCVCQHNTDGPNCERCKSFFQDVPWRPAAGLQDSMCRACHCNGHSDRCHFDTTTYLASGGRSGGVCEHCQHHTEGQHCDRCRPLFYRDPLKAMSDPYACIPCECDPDGTLSGGICVSHSDPALGSVAGQCLCKANVQGAKCDQCKPNHHGLRADDPLGCQPCNCNPLGSLPLSACDVETGQCSCQPFATGPHCEECSVGYWGLENHLHGCFPCDCDIGGAYSNVCSPKDGQCECRPHVTGRSCTDPAPGYFFAPLNFYLYEAEEATPLQGLAPLIAATTLPTCDVFFQQQGSDFIVDKGKIILKKNQKQSVRADEKSEGSVTFGQVPAVHVVFREPVPGTPTAWTGTGFAQVLPGAGLRFAVDHIAFPMDFTIAIRYETQPAANWAVQVLVKPLGESQHCARETPWPRPRSFPLPATSRLVLLPTPICLEPDVQYSVDVYFSQPSEGGAHAHTHILVDSLSLIPQIDSLENFCSKQDSDEYQLHNCVDIALKTEPQVLPGACERLIASMAAKLHNGAIACKCHPQGSVGPSCSRLGGQCQCKPHVAGRCCDRCLPGSHGLGHHGCLPCHCHPQGSKSSICDQITGQCPCQGEVAGLHCDRCLAGYFGFPSCRPCLCNGFAELCDPETGSCFNCGGFTTGRNCERCIDGYYGDPPSGQPCRPCPCPDVPSSNQYFAHSCYQDPWSTDVICNCLQGYAGKQCAECSAGFYGNPRIPGAPCHPCACNNNIDVTDPESCSRVTGECLRCLHNTQGPNCQFCKPGHFGSAVNQTCRRCSCPFQHNSCWCPPGQGACLSNPDTRTCPCLPNVMGQVCDRCADRYWNLVPGRGCQPCDCDPWTSHGDHCDQLTGQCPCKVGYDGKHCTCDCNTEGTQKPVCDQNTGMCHCREGVSGPRCDRCARGHGQEFPACLRCHRCFDQWDHTTSSLSKAVQGLMGLAANMEDKRETLLVCEADFKGLRENMSEIERILKHPVFSSGEFLKVKDYHDSVREQVMQLSMQLKAVHEFQDLKETMVRMKNEADLLLEDLRKEIDLRSSARNANIMDSSETIKKHYQRSSSVEKKINETTSIIKNSEKTRNDVLRIFDMLSSKENLSLEKLKQIRIPDIQILIEKCKNGIDRHNADNKRFRCSGTEKQFPGGLHEPLLKKYILIEQCFASVTLGGIRESTANMLLFNRNRFPGEVCGEPGDMSCVLPPCGDPTCRGSRTVSSSALQRAQEAESVIQTLSDQVQGWKNQLKNVSKLTEVSKNNALQLSEKLRNMKNQSESEQEKMSLLIKKLKKFLSEENVPPKDIEKVANRVLDIHLPIPSQNLTHELDKIRKLTQLCEDYGADEGRLNKAAEEAQKVLEKAKKAEKAANVLLNLDKTLNRLQQVQITQGRVNSTITQLTAEITKITKNALQAGKEAKDTESKLDLAKQQWALAGGLSRLQTTLQRNREQASRVQAQATSARRQAGGLEQEFAELTNQYAVLQHKTSAIGLTQVTLDKVEQLKEAVGKLAVDTEDKIRRIADLEKRIQDLNLSRQEKADHLKELEDQVVAIKNEIVEQENKYATCYS